MREGGRVKGAKNICLSKLIIHTIIVIEREGLVIGFSVIPVGIIIWLAGMMRAIASIAIVFAEPMSSSTIVPSTVFYVIIWCSTP